MKKLEPKHLAPYLPYGLKFITVPELENSIQTLKIGSIIQKGFITLDDVFYNGKLECKPILRPLSDMTKEEYIEFYGYPEWYLKDESFMDEPYKVTLEHLIAELKGGGSFQLEQFSFLFKKHFDLDGLIPEGLAIDINTLENIKGHD